MHLLPPPQGEGDYDSLRAAFCSVLLMRLKLISVTNQFSLSQKVQQYKSKLHAAAKKRHSLRDGASDCRERWFSVKAPL